TASSPAALMSVRNSRAPSFAAAMASARPMPLAAPVMKHCLSARSSIGIVAPVGRDGTLVECATRGRRHPLSAGPQGVGSGWRASGRPSMTTNFLCPDGGWATATPARIPPPPPARRGLLFRAVARGSALFGRPDLPDIFPVLHIHRGLFWPWLLFASRLM